MPTTVQFRRGTEAQNDAFTGSAGEITYDTTNNTLRAHDGSTAGGSTLATQSYVTTQLGGISSEAITNGTSNVAVAANSSVTVTVAGSTAATFASTGLTVAGNLTVNGTTTTINSTTLTVDDKTIVVASGSADGAAADGAGISVDGASATITYANTGDKWAVNKDFDLSSNDILNAGTINGTSTSAQYADLAENYSADADYEPGTVLVVGGDAEVTACSQYADSASAGVVSTNPAHLMNSGLDTPNTVALALAGRVPCKIVGTVIKGDLLTTSEKSGVATRLLPDSFVPGCVIGKALENYDSNEIGIIEVLVGKS